MEMSQSSEFTFEKQMHVSFMAELVRWQIIIIFSVPIKWCSLILLSDRRIEKLEGKGTGESKLQFYNGKDSGPVKASCQVFSQNSPAFLFWDCTDTVTLSIRFVIRTMQYRIFKVCLFCQNIFSHDKPYEWMENIISEKRVHDCYKSFPWKIK